ncbi:MAG TPA: M24 family metallopeptidase [Spirochaetes bacterium]|nr:M24 family metallopeptidase [Spirochaetota bacterium]
MKTREWKREADFIARLLKRAPDIDREFRIGTAEFKMRQKKVFDGLQKAGFDCGLVFSNEHYDGDVPYLGGNTNVAVEACAGIIGKNGFHIITGLEGGYVVEQLAPRSGAKVHKAEVLQLADEDYPIDAERFEDVIEEACDGKPDAIGLLTPRAVLPVHIYELLSAYLGSSEKIVDVQTIYYKIKYEKSDSEMKLVENACLIADVMVEGMLGVLKPGMYETQVAGWGSAIAYELGVEQMGFDLIVNTGEANRSLIGKAVNEKIKEGDFVHVGVGPRLDGLAACERVSVVAVDDPSDITDDQRFWITFIEEAYQAGLDAFIEAAKKNLPAKHEEEALIAYYKKREAEVNKRFGINVDLPRQKPYTGVHNSGYTECYEFYGAITLESEEPLGNQIVNMMDVAIRGVGNYWDDVLIPGLDYVVIEKTLGKYGKDVKVLNNLPINVQHLTGKA